MSVRFACFTGILLLASSAFAAGRIVVGHDVNTLGTFVAGTNEDQFAVNLARWLTGATSGKVLAVESSPGDGTRDYALSVKAALASAGFTVTYISDPATVSAETLANLQAYDAVFVGETFPTQTSISPSVLTQYVNSGGNVYMYGGVDESPSGEAALLNPFLQAFGLAFDTTTYNGLNSVNITSTHPIFNGLTGKTLGSGNGQDIHDLSTNPNASIVQFQGPHGVYAVVNSGGLPSSCSPIVSLAIINYHVLNQQSAAGNQSYITYRADLVNSGTALGAVTATLTSLDPFTLRVVPGQGTLTFAPVPANSQVPSSNTFTILTDATVPVDFNKLQWTFQTTPAPPVAIGGPNQTVPVGTTVTLDGSGSTNLSCIGTLTYSWMFTSRPPGTATRSFYTTGAVASFLADVPGDYVIQLTVSNGVASSSTSVTVTAGAGAGVPVLTSISPNAGQQGASNPSVTITGEFTHFAQGTSTVSLGSDITVNAVTVANATSLAVSITIPANATLGAHTATVTTGGETVLLANAFTVTPGSPAITLLNPSSGQTEQIVGDIRVCYNCADSYVHSPLIYPYDDLDGPVFIFENTSGLDITSGLFSLLGPTSVATPDSFNVGRVPVTSPLTVTPGVSDDGNVTHTFFTYTGSIRDTSDVGPDQGNIQFRFTGLQGSLTIDSGMFTPDTSQQDINDGISFSTPMNFLGGPGNGDGGGCACLGPQPVAPLVSLGTNINLTVTGVFTHFVQGSTIISLGSDLIVNSITVTSATSLTANVTIATTATLGAHNVSVTTGTEAISLPNAFTVNAPTPTLLWTATNSISGQTQQVTIAGQFTHFVGGTTLASFGPGISVGGAALGSFGPVTVRSSTVATATLVVGASAAPGLRTVSLQTGSELVSLPNGFVVSNQPPSFTINPASAQQLQTITVNITGTNTNFVAGVTKANFGPGISVGGAQPGFFGPVTVTGPTSATAVAYVGPTAPIGLSVVTVETGAERETLPVYDSGYIQPLVGGFTIVASGPSITSVSPNSGQQGQGGAVAIVGQNTHFAQGTTHVDFGSGITVSNITVSCPTCLTVQLTVAATAPVGPHDVTVTSSSEVVKLTGGFTVIAGTPILTSLVPASGQQGQTFPFTVTGNFTHFTQGTTQVSLGTGVTVIAISVTSATALTAQAAIDPAATPGTRTLTVTTGTEVVSATNVFTVQAATPIIYTLNPGGGSQGQQNLSVLITGLATHFVQGTSVATFGAGVTVTSLTVASATSATAIVNIDPAAVPGTRTVTVTTGSEAASFTNGFAVNASGPIIYTLNPGGSSQGVTNLQVQITGLSTHFVQGTSAASFGAGITVTSLAVTNATTATATIKIDVAATIGPRTVTVTTGTEVASFVNGFTVVAGVPGITQINPGGGLQGIQNLSVAVTAQFTHFVQGTTTATFGAGITVNSVTVTDSTHLSVSISISSTAATGNRTVTVTTGTEVVSGPNGFLVGTPSPTIVSVAPTSATQGQQNVNITITGQFTNFLQGTTNVGFGGAGITVNSVTVASATSLAANISLAANATEGTRTVTVTTGAEVASLANGFTVQQVANQPPAITIAPTWNVTLPNSLTITYTVSDPGLAQGGTLTVTWSTVIGTGTVGFQNQTPTSIVASFSQAGSYTLQISATDSFTQLTTTQNITVTVTGTLPPPPTVSITSPTEGTQITTLTNVTGSVASSALASWTLQMRMQTETNYRMIASGTTAVTNGTLGTFDPTLLLNGIALIQLTATDMAGQTSTFGPVSVVVTGNQKVGNFTVSFNDLTVPLEGLPIQVVRTYDSRNKLIGDFGVGWTLDVKTVQVSTNGALGDNWTETSTGGAFPNYCIQAVKAHVVTVNFSDGTTYTFQPALNPQCQHLVPIQDQPIAMTFTPTGITPPNVTLAVRGGIQPLVEGSVPGPVTLVDPNTLGSFDPDLYQLTLPDGRVFVLSKQLGLQSMTDLNGNKLTVTPAGITHSSGKSVAFQRDGFGRITKVTDPAGNSIQYAYNGTGDLTGVTDRGNNITTFTYDTNHGLLTIVDPAGVQPIKNVYDNSGRLIQHIDAFGKVINYTNNLAAQQEIVTDRLGNVTANYYDANGNILKVTDAAGGNTVRTYDSRNNLLTETNPLNETRTYTYDANNNRLTEVDPLGNTTTYTYNSRNQVLTVTDALNRVTTNIYDGSGNLLSVKDPSGNTTTYTYNAAGLQTSATDPLGGVTSSQYDSSGNLTQQTDALMNITTYSYDANGNRLSQTKTRTGPNGLETLVTGYQYDSLNRLTKTTYPDGSTTQIQYNAIGKQSVTIDQLNRQTSYQYDLMGRLTQTTYPDTTTESSTYDAEGDRTASTDRASRTTTYVYDPLKRLTQTVYADNTSTTTTYDLASEVTAVKDARGNVTQYLYDGAGRRTQVMDALNHISTFAYDRVGNQVSMMDANGNTTQYQYDNNNRRTKVIYSDTTADSTVYDALGRSTSKTDQASKTTQYFYDKLGRLVQVTDARNQLTKYGYDEVGNRISQTDANGHTTSFAYDKLGRRIKRTLPLGMSETFTYDAAGNMSSHTDFNGKTTGYLYDAVNRLTTKTPDPSFAAPAITFGYTATGQRQSMADAHGTTSYTYDLRDRLLSKSTPEGTLTYTYEQAGNLSTIRSSNSGGSTADYIFDALNRLAAVKDNRLASGTTAYTYDNAGNLAGYQYPNGVKSAYIYNTLNRLTNMALTAGANTLGSYAYTLGAAGNRTAVAELGGRQVSYTYDELYRLNSETITGGSVNGTIGYTYDAVGNRFSRTSTVVPIPAATNVYDANDRLTSDTYDSNGNTTVSGANTYAYDFENHLATQNVSGVVIVYDGDGNRVSKTASGLTTKYLVDDRNLTGYAQVLEEISGGTVQRVYTYGFNRISQSQASGTSFYGYDGHGNVRILTDATGAVTDRYDYDAFGNITSQAGTTPNVYLYSGEQNDSDLNLYFNRARYYGPRSGRFWTMDVVESPLDDPLSLNRYAYANADAVDNVDPSGTQALNVEEVEFVQVGVNILQQVIAPSILALPSLLRKVAESETPDFLIAYHYLTSSKLSVVKAKDSIPVGADPKCAIYVEQPSCAFFTPNVYSTSTAAFSGLALPNVPQWRIELFLLPQQDGLKPIPPAPVGAGGLEFVTPNPIGFTERSLSVDRLQ